MSKYSLQLQQIVKSNLFQDVIVSINYDGDGPKLVSVESDKFDPSIKHSIDTVMGVVNLGLSKGITPKEMAEQMEIEPKDDNVNETDISHILKLVASSLKQAPAKSNQINPEILNRIAPEMIKDFTQTIKTTVIQLGKGTSSAGDDSKPRFSFFGRGDDQTQTQAPAQEVASETSSNTQDTKPADDNSYQYTDQNQSQYQQNQTQSGYDDGYAQPENNNPYGNSQAQAPQAQNPSDQNANTQNANQNQDQEQTQTEESGHGRRSFFSGFGRH